MTEQEYFNETVNKVLTQVGCTMDIDISILDHDTLKGKCKNAIGIYWNNRNGNYNITIDEFFVHECYEYFILDSFSSTWELGICETLEHVICHELAHILYWRHGKNHTDYIIIIIQVNYQKNIMF